eukprot:CAMPEP_0168584614 /NCGR_PEP_ID=MMETSP0420-20121227/3237_1 /TAXON_ID=498008 /ORGANISM="Pessonella sp." /LENGTH=156 /DNA_ID=CAMNT_0008619435 /DNA_START=248 /DNA_END=718 /DNA_ORIENTATION=+
MKNENTSANRSGFESGTGREQFQSKNKLLFRKRLRQPDFFSSYSTQQQTDRSQNFTKHETSQWQNNKDNKDSKLNQDHTDQNKVQRSYNDNNNNNNNKNEKKLSGENIKNNQDVKRETAKEQQGWEKDWSKSDVNSDKKLPDHEPIDEPTRNKNKN